VNKSILKSNKAVAGELLHQPRSMISRFGHDC